MTKGPYTPAPSYRTNHIQKNVNHSSAYDLSTTSDIADVSLGGHRVMVIRKLAEVPKGATCQHENMKECCEGCGHFSCSCGLSWDDNYEGGPLEEETGPNKEDFE